MENKLNFRRVFLLMKSYWIEGKKLILLGVGIIIGLIIFLYSTNISTSNTTYPNGAIANLLYINNQIQQYIFICGLNGVGIILITNIFKNYSSKNASTNGLLVPASYLEKLLAGILVCIVFFPFVFCIIFFSIDYLYISLLNIKMKSLNVTYIAINEVKQNVPYIFQIIEKPEKFIKPLIGAWLCTQTFTIIGMIHFQRQALIKTLAFGTIIILAFVLINKGLSDLLILPLFESRTPGIMIGGPDFERIYSINNQIISYILLYILPPIFIITAYFKLKEKQV